MLIRKPTDIIPSDITPRSIYQRRREFIKQASALGLLAAAHPQWAPAQSPTAPRLAAKPSRFSVSEKQTSYQDVTTYNNFYEFGTDKDEPALYAPKMKTRPWAVVVDGELRRPRTFSIEELLKLAPMEERVYRMRCVEAWSMVIPWIGYPLAELIKRVEPTGKAKYVAFSTAADKESMVGLRLPVLEWPYSEGLRLDEAMHPLSILGFGLYGEVLPNQNGAPVRLVVPWKYGFKSAKSLARISFVENEPKTAWNTAAPQEYGFYSNVNPDVDHPRWSQATERRIGEDGFFTQRRKTLRFNGYADQVAGLYKGMDLTKQY